MTKSNDYEARYITQLCRYLMLQGYKSSQITILTTYIGQMFLIKKVKSDRTTVNCHNELMTVLHAFTAEAGRW